MTSTLKLFPHKRQKNGDIINSLISKRTKVLCNLNVLPVEVLSRVIMFLDLSDLPRALPLSKIWYTAYKDVEQDLWLTLVRKHHPFLESLTTELFRGNGPQIKCEKDLPDDANKKQILPSPSFDWKKQFRRRQIYLRNDAPSFRRAVPVPPPCSLSHYIFQVDLKCHLQPVRGMPKQTKILTVIASASEGLVEWDVDRLNINLESAQVDLSRLPLFSFDVSVYVIQRETAKQALLYKGSPEDWMDFGCCMYDSFSSPQTLFSDFGTYVALEATKRCECRCGYLEGGTDNFFHRTLCTCVHCSCCECCQCHAPGKPSERTPWACFDYYRLEIHPYSNLEDIQDLSEKEFLVYLERGLHYA